MADIVLRYVLIPASMSAQKIYNWDLLKEVPGLAEWNAIMANQEISQQLDQASQKGMASFLAAIKSK
jgi:hypothetical protein